ncbi:MAG: Rab family GTPase [Pseudomonadota bacterium]
MSLRFKICVLGEFAVGKTSTVARVVRNEFSETYQTTVGVSIDVKQMQNDAGDDVKLILWDIAGTDRLASLDKAYLQGMDGYVLVCDGTRPDTLTTAVNLYREVVSTHGDKPFIALVNKNDLVSDWAVSDDQLTGAGSFGIHWTACSAKRGDHVEQAFRRLANELTEH